MQGLLNADYGTVMESRTSALQSVTTAVSRLTATRTKNWHRAATEPSSSSPRLDHSRSSS